MSIAQGFLAEFELEAKTTRKFLERLPADKLAWKPHEKSMAAGQLALHIAAAPADVLRMTLNDTFTMPDFQLPLPTSVAEIVAAHDQTVETVRNLLPTISDSAMTGLWRLLGPDGTELLAMPRVNVLRSIMLNHWIHHRGQFGVYLRLLGAKVPSSYGPSGDEIPDFMAK